MKEYTGIVFDTDIEDDMDDIFGYLMEELGFEMCFDNKELPGAILLKPESPDSIEDLKEMVESFCKTESLSLSNLYIFKTNSFVHETDEDCE